jgi:hypothetical protein
MSNVTLPEIIDLTADAFSVPCADMRRQPKDRRKHVSWLTYARYCAAMLARRHTTVGLYSIRKALGMTFGGSQVKQFEDMLDRFEEEARQYPVLSRLIAEVEGRIDQIHESRVDEYVTASALKKNSSRAPRVLSVPATRSRSSTSSKKRRSSIAAHTQ